MTSRPKSSTSLSALIRSAPGREELREILSRTSKDNNDRSAAITIAALLEGALESAIQSRLRPLNKTETKSLFGPSQPLSSFSAKINIGHAIRLFGQNTRSDLHRIREVRNAFAHTRHPITFNTKEVKAVCEGIVLVDRAATRTIGTPRIRFLGTAAVMTIYFDGLESDRRIDPDGRWAQAIAS